MEQILYDFWTASLQDGYIGNLADIVERAGGSKALYEMSDELMASKLKLSSRMIKHIINRRNTINIESEYDLMKSKDIGFVRYFDSGYPSRLRDIASKPFALFYKGKLPEDAVPSVAVVGARDCSEYGRLMAEYFADRLAKLRINIISGMAYGIDGIAQMSALDAGGKSYAVLGCGVDVIYPRSNRRLYERLIDEGGGVISEYIPSTAATARNFPPRNRIISGLSDMLLVVEAKSKSGTLITADMAMDQGKDVGVVPGRLTDPLSIGCLNLIKQGAMPVVNVEDIAGHLGIREGIEKTIAIEPEKEMEFSDDEQRVFGCIDYYPRSAEEIARRVSMDIKKVLGVLTLLEIKGAIISAGQTSFVKKS